MDERRNGEMKGMCLEVGVLRGTDDAWKAMDLGTCVFSYEFACHACTSELPL